MGPNHLGQQLDPRIRNEVDIWSHLTVMQIYQSPRQEDGKERKGTEVLTQKELPEELDLGGRI